MEKRPGVKVAAPDTLADTIQTAVAPYVPQPLIAPEHFPHIAAIAELMPASLTDFFGFESRLGDVQAQADFLFSVTAKTGAHEMLGGLAFPPLPPADVKANQVWERLRHLGTLWADPGSALHTKLKNLWLEFDIAGPCARLPLPNVFIGPHAHLLQRQVSEPATCTGHPHQWVTHTAFPALFGQALPSPMAEYVLSCFDALPTGAYVFQMGAMLARPIEAIRLCVRGISPGDILTYLSQLGWTGDAQRLRAILESLSTFVARIDLDIDVGTRVEPKIGLECYAPLQTPDASRWKPLLDHLVAENLCLAEKSDALQAYTGIVDSYSHRHAWPRHFLNAEAFLGSRVLSTFMRYVHHIKITYQERQLLEAKAYLAVTHHWHRLS